MLHARGITIIIICNLYSIERTAESRLKKYEEEIRRGLEERKAPA
jgi:hypothetical protein